MLNDQAAGLRNLGANMATKPRPTRVLSVASGKGGVGKSNLSVNLAIALAQSGERVIVMDADMSLANVDVLLGLSPQHTLLDVLLGQKQLIEVLMPGPGNIRIIPATSGIRRLAEMTEEETQRLVVQLNKLAPYVDTLIVDTAAGIAPSVVQFCRAADQVLVVVLDEPTSVTDAYALIKVLVTEYGVQNIQIVTNMVDGDFQGQILFEKLKTATSQFFNFTPQYLGFIPRDTALRQAVRRQKAVLLDNPSAPASKAIVELARMIKHQPITMAEQHPLARFAEHLRMMGAQQL